MVNVNTLLRRIHFVIHVVTIGVCGVVFFPLGSVYRAFEEQCVLNAKLVITEGGAGPNGTVSVLVDAERSVLGDSSVCNYVTYMPVIVAIHAFIWCWFLIYLWASLVEQGREISLFLPAIILHSLLLICLIVSSTLLSVGIGNFCDNLEILLPNKYSCDDIQDFYWSGPINKQQTSFITNLNIASIASWVLAVLLLAHCFIICYQYWRHTSVTYEVTSIDDDYVEEKHGIVQDYDNTVNEDSDDPTTSPAYRKLSIEVKYSDDDDKKRHADVVVA